MDETEKPFACPSPGCNMSFTNEDHLVVHRKKHDMILNLGSNGKNTFVADQTPTPTRFIRNCEEVGLFQDLQNVNPFEETFRRAVECGKTGSLSEPEVGGIDDTLHTPHIFPNISDVTSTTVSSNASKKPEDLHQDSHPHIDKNLSVPDERDTSILSESNTTIVSKTNEMIIVEQRKQIEVHGDIVVQEADTSIATKPRSTQAPPHLSINGQEVQLLLKTADGKLMQLSATPLNDNRNIQCLNGKSLNLVQEKATINTTSEINNVQKSPNRMTIAKMRLKQSLTKAGTTTESSPPNDARPSPKIPKPTEKALINMEQRKKQEVQARNRASSMRARAKRKYWIQDLQQTANTANEKNAALQQEVEALRREVARLRALLLAHDNCPVTKSLKKRPLVVIDPKTPSIGVPVIQNIRISPPILAPGEKRKKSISERPIASKTFITSTLKTKPHVILPKPEVKGIPVIKDISPITIVDVRSLVDDRDPGNRIVLVANPSGNHSSKFVLDHSSKSNELANRK